MDLLTPNSFQQTRCRASGPIFGMSCRYFLPICWPPLFVGQALWASFWVKVQCLERYQLITIKSSKREEHLRPKRNQPPY